MQMTSSKRHVENQSPLKIEISFVHEMSLLDKQFRRTTYVWPDHMT